MPLQETFSLTPTNLWYWDGPNNYAWATVHGPSFLPDFNHSFNTQYSEDKLYYPSSYAADPALNYQVWSNLKMAPRIEFCYDLSALGENKELALVFGFEAVTDSRLLIYTGDGLLDEETLVAGDNQFLIEVETLDQLTLYFINAALEGSTSGGQWFFKGITGYVV